MLKKEVEVTMKSGITIGLGGSRAFREAVTGETHEPHYRANVNREEVSKMMRLLPRGGAALR